MDLMSELRKPIPIAIGLAAVLGWSFGFYSMSTISRNRADAEARLALMTGSQRMLQTELEQQRQTGGTLADLRGAVTKATQEREAAVAETAEAARQHEALRRAAEETVAVRDRALADLTQRTEKAQQDEIAARQAMRQAREAADDAQRQLAEIRGRLTDALDQSNRVASALRDRTDELARTEADLITARQRLDAARAEQAEIRKEIEAQKVKSGN